MDALLRQAEKDLHLGDSPIAVTHFVQTLHGLEGYFLRIDEAGNQVWDKTYYYDPNTATGPRFNYTWFEIAPNSLNDLPNASKESGP